MLRVSGIDLTDGYWWSEAHTGIHPKDSIYLELWTTDGAKTRAYEDAVRALAEIIGLTHGQLMKRLWAGKKPFPSFWYKRVAVAWFDRKLVEGLEP